MQHLIIIFLLTSQTPSPVKGIFPCLRPQEPVTKPCNTEVCKDRANLLRRLLVNHQLRCEDFYDYVCKNYYTKQTHYQQSARTDLVLAVKQTLKNILDKQAEKADPKTMTDRAVYAYKNCVSTATNEKLQVEYLEEAMTRAGFKPWPKPETAKFETDAWVNILGQIAVQNILRFSVDLRLAEKLKPRAWTNVIKVTPPPFPILPKEDMCALGKNLRDPRRSKYIDLIKSTFGFIDHHRFSPESEYRSTLNRMATEILQVESVLACFAMSDTPSDHVHEYLLSKVDAAYNPVPLSKIIALKFRLAEAQIPSPAVVQIHDNDYPKHAWRHITGLSNSNAVYNYIGYLTLVDIAKDSVEVFVKLVNDFYKAIGVGTAMEPPRLRCLETIMEVMPLPLSQMYLKEKPDKQGVEAMKNIMPFLQRHLEKQLQDSLWLNRKDKARGKEKIKKMTLIAGHGMNLEDEKEINEQYKYVPNFQRGWGFPLILWYLRINNIKVNLQKITGKSTKTTWPMDILTTPPYYRGFENTAYYPASALQGVLYTPGIPLYAYLGAAGSILGHEFAHALDEKSQQYDCRGDFKPWIVERDSLAQFELSKECFVKQYSDTLDTTAGIKLNGRRTFNEDVTDNTGLRATYHAFKDMERCSGFTEQLPGFEDFSSDQMFFVHFALEFCASENTRQRELKAIETSVHSPNKYRVNIALGNFHKFSEAFRCGRGTKMNFTKKCIMF